MSTATGTRTCIDCGMSFLPWKTARGEYLGNYCEKCIQIRS